MNKTFRPDPDTVKLTSATRFGAKPSHKNTFGNFQHEQNYPGYISEQDRVPKRTDFTMNSKVQY